MIDVQKTTLIDPAKLQPAPYNPRRIGKRQMAALRASIREHGFVEPVVAQKRTMHIIGGHQRVKALVEECKAQGAPVPRIPVVLLDVDDRKARILNLALNKIGGDFDQDLLANMLNEMQTQQELTPEELLASGFTDAELDRIMGENDGDDLKPFAQSVTLSLQFDTPEQRDAVKALLKERTAKSGKKSGAIVHGLLTGN